MFRKICFLVEVEKVLRVWIKQHNQEIRDLHSSPDIIKVIKMRGIIWARQKASRVEKNAQKYLVGKPARKGLL